MILIVWGTVTNSQGQEEKLSPQEVTWMFPLSFLAAPLSPRGGVSAHTSPLTLSLGAEWGQHFSSCGRTRPHDFDGLRNFDKSSGPVGKTTVPSGISLGDSFPPLPCGFVRLQDDSMFCLQLTAHTTLHYTTIELTYRQVFRLQMFMMTKIMKHWKNICFCLVHAVVSLYCI